MEKKYLSTKNIMTNFGNMINLGSDSSGHS